MRQTPKQTNACMQPNTTPSRTEPIAKTTKHDHLHELNPTSSVLHSLAILAQGFALQPITPYDHNLEGGALAHFYRKRIVSSEILNNLCSKSNPSLRPVRNTSISSQFRVKNGTLMIQSAELKFTRIKNGSPKLMQSSCQKKYREMKLVFQDKARYSNKIKD